MPHGPGPRNAAPLWGPPGDAAPACEDDILAMLDALFPSRTVHTPLGRGHDCAELAVSGPLALSTDLFWQDAHFRPAYFSPQEAGGKALTAAASDLAAAGAVPLGFSLGLLLPPRLGKTALHGLLAGMADKARAYGMALSGGDLTRGEALGLSLTVWGERLDPATPFLRRAGCRPGDRIILVGRAGLARAGLWALERGGRAALADWPEACRAFLDPQPLFAQGQALARLAAEQEGAAGRIALMDVSDGLARDLPRLLGPLGAALDYAPDLIPAEARAAAPAMGLDEDALFLLGGEDYALLCTCPDAFWPRLRASLPEARALGLVTEEPGLLLRGAPVRLDGFDHFSGSSPAGPPAVPGQPGGLENKPGPSLPPGAADSLILCCREAWQTGLMAGFSGNASRRAALPAPGGGETGVCLITRSGAAKARLTPADFALLALDDGRPLHGPAASTESAVHLGIYRRCPESRFILHTHPPCLLALCLALPPEDRLALPLPEAGRCRNLLAWTPPHPPGSAALGETVALAAQTSPAVWMEGHGLVVHGPDPAFVLSLTEELEQLAKVQLLGRR